MFSCKVVGLLFAFCFFLLANNHGDHGIATEPQRGVAADAWTDFHRYKKKPELEPEGEGEGGVKKRKGVEEPPPPQQQQQQLNNGGQPPLMMMPSPASSTTTTLDQQTTYDNGGVVCGDGGAAMLVQLSEVDVEDLACSKLGHLSSNEQFINHVYVLATNWT